MISADRTLNVCIVTFNSAKHIGNLIASLPKGAGALSLNVLVVDNGSSDNTAAVARSSGVTVIETGMNLGYSGGINVGRREFGRGNIAILNPDLVLNDRCLEFLVDDIGPEVGIAVPRLVDGDGQVFTHLRREATIVGTLGDSMFGAHWPGRPRALSGDLRRAADYEEPRDVAWAGAAAWVVSADCNEWVGQWNDRRYFLYSEETDYARRARDLGFRVHFDPRASAAHHGGGSGTSDSLLALMSVNQVRYFESLHGSARSTLYRCAVALRHGLRLTSAPHRRALVTVLSRRSWPSLPGGRRAVIAEGRAE